VVGVALRAPSEPGQVYDRRQALAKARILREKYGKLARSYSNIAADGIATGGSVEMTQRPDGSFEVTGLNHDRTVDGESILWMDEKADNFGTAHYCHKVGVGYGIQHIRYIPQQDILHVRGVRESASPIEFFHTWRPRKEKIQADAVAVKVTPHFGQRT
jgi:hypothetical protein